VYKKMVFILVVTPLLIAAQNPNFTLAANGITCLCKNAAVGDAETLTINGEQKICTKKTVAEPNVLMIENQIFSYRRLCTKCKPKK
jgi:hypothetical protein